MRAEAAPIIVIGMGNPMRRDDGVGHALLEKLDGESFGCSAGIDLLALDGESTRLLEAWRGRRRAIIVDAGGRGDVPGSIHRLEVGTDELPAGSSSASSHSAGLAEAVALAGVLDALPDQLVVLAVEPADMSQGEGLSGPVAAILPELADRVRNEATA